MGTLADREFSITYSIAVGLWLVAAAMIVTNWFVRPDLGPAAIWVTAIASCLTVRGYLCKLAWREKRAFEIGAELGRADVAAERGLHRV